jgi:hypothetical protein
MTEHEAKIDGELRKRGYGVLVSGWPDRLCFRKRPDGSIEAFCVEIKANGDQVKPNQILAHSILIAAGLPTHVVRTEADLDKVGTTGTTTLHDYMQDYIREAETYFNESVARFEKRLHELIADHEKRKKALLLLAEAEVEKKMAVSEEQARRLIESATEKIATMRELFRTLTLAGNAGNETPAKASALPSAEAREEVDRVLGR